MNLMTEATKYALEMRQKPNSANDIMQVGANTLAKRFRVPYADAKATIRLCFDGNPVGFESRVL